MGSGIVAILQFGLLTFLTAVAVGVLITVCSQIQISILRHLARETELRDRIAAYSRLITGFQERVENRKAAAAGAASILFGSERQEKQLRTRLRELEREPHRFVRVVGAEQLPNRPFEIMAVNSSVAHQVARGERHAFYDGSWARPCPVHVWASGPEEAKSEFERVFPRTTGFKLLSIQALNIDGPVRTADGQAEAPMENRAGAERASKPFSRRSQSSAEMPA